MIELAHLFFSSSFDTTEQTTIDDHEISYEILKYGLVDNFLEKIGPHSSDEFRGQYCVITKFDLLTDTTPAQQPTNSLLFLIFNQLSF
jgi:hypothetical protein